MYLHLGQNVLVPKKSVIGVFDMDNTTQSKWTVKFLNQAEKEGRLINISDDIPKSFIVCDHPYHRQIVYISQLNSSTLAKRSEEQRVALGEGE